MWGLEHKGGLGSLRQGWGSQGTDIPREGQATCHGWSPVLLETAIVVEHEGARTAEGQDLYRTSGPWAPGQAAESPTLTTLSPAGPGGPAQCQDECHLLVPGGQRRHAAPAAPRAHLRGAG